MPTKPLRTDHTPGVPYRVSGETLNRQNETTNAINAGHGIQRGTSGINTGIKTDIPPVPFIYGLAEITGASNQCPTDNTEFSGKGFPCVQENKYTVEFRYYDEDTGTYKKYGETLELDASGYYEASNVQSSAPSSGPGYGPIPGYSVGDVTPAYLDVQRNKLIPVQSPPSDPSHAVFYQNDRQVIDQPGAVGSVDVSVVEFYIEQFRAGVDNDFRVIGTISFPLTFFQNGLSYMSSTTFNTAPCPHGTLFRIRQVAGRNFQDLTVKSYWQRLRFTGLGRRNPRCIAASVVENSIPGGTYTLDWTPDESTLHRFNDAPTFTAITSDPSTQPGLIQVSYQDPKDEWMIGIELYAQIQINSEQSGAYDCCVCKKFQTAFGHLKNITVAVGDVLKQGDQIGEVGALGTSDPHLHYEARFGATAANFTVANDPTNGQSFDIDDVQNFPKVGARAPGTAPGAAQGTPAEIAHAKSTMTIKPIDEAHCVWFEQLGSGLHNQAKYYAKDLSCEGQNQEGATVSNFVDALTVVLAVDAQYGGVLLEHYCDECVSFKNTESQEAVPAYGVMRVIKGTTSGKRTLYEIGKPSIDFQRFYLVNGDEEVAAGAYGCGKWLDEAGLVLYDEFPPAVDVGQSWGAKNDSWALVKNRPGFTVIGESTTVDDLRPIFSAIQYQVNNLKGKALGDLSKGVAGPVLVWMRNAKTGAWEQAEYLIQADPLGSDLAPALFLALEWDCGEWVAACLES